MTKNQQLLQLLAPYRDMTLSFGCEVTPDGGNGSVAKIYKIYEDDTFDGLIEGTTEDGEAEFVVTITKGKLSKCKILGHPPTLATVLMALKEQMFVSVTGKNNMRLMNDRGNVFVELDLTQTPDQYSEEVSGALVDLLSKIV